MHDAGSMRQRGKLMKRTYAVLLILTLMTPCLLHADMLGNPGYQVGSKNLFVGVEYTSMMQKFDLDTSDLETSSERVSLKLTTGLSEKFDIFLKVGGASLKLDYRNNNYVYRNINYGYAVKNFDSDMEIGFGGGARLRLLNFVDSGIRVFAHGGGYYFQAESDINWQTGTGNFIKEREIKWADLYGGLGIAKRFDFVDLNFGVGFSEIKWWINDVDVTQSGSFETRTTVPERDSFEYKAPVFGFIGLDFVLPHEYRISAQAGIRNLDEVEFSVAVSQGLEKEF
jgi:hypothetical protein